MIKVKIGKILALIVIFVGIVVMVGWVLDIGVFKSIIPQWVTMKFSTALSFVMSGLVVFFVIKRSEGKGGIANIIIPISSMVILLFMATLIVSVIVGVKTGIEDLFVRESSEAVRTIIPGRPSVGTMIAFILIATSGLISMFNLKIGKQVLNYIGLVIIILGGLALLGYLFNAEILYYTIEGWSTAMAIHTAVLFVLVGIGLLLIGKSNQGENQ